MLAKGEPQGACFTVSVQTMTLETDWSTAQQTTYNAGDPGAGAIADDWARHNAHQTARTKDKLKKVYRYFRIPPTWDGKVSGNYVWPLDQNNLNVSLPYWWPGLRLQDRLPLRLEHDYTNPVAVTNAMKTSSKWQYQRPFVYVAPTGERAYFLDRAGRGETVDTHSEASGRFWSAGLQMQDNALGIIVDVHGAPQHMIAKTTWTAADAADETDYAPDADYNYLYATVFAEADGHVTRAWPEGPINAGTDTLKELVIYVPNARLDYVVPGTTIDIGTDGVPIQSTGGFVRDDTDFLKNVARSAYQWYSTPRKSMSVTIHELGFSFGVGQAGAESIWLGSLITTIGGAVNAATLNTVVTRITFDLLAGTSTYLTQFAEFDVQ